MCTFRVSNFLQIKQNRSKWLSPPFFVLGGYKMRIVFMQMEWDLVKILTYPYHYCCCLMMSWNSLYLSHLILEFESNSWGRKWRLFRGWKSVQQGRRCWYRIHLKAVYKNMQTEDITAVNPKKRSSYCSSTVPSAYLFCCLKKGPRLVV